MRPRWRVALPAALLAALAIALLWPLRHAALHTDDWAWLALAHEATSPWAAYTEGLMFGYFYRPTAFFWWFVSERLWGDTAALHYAASVLIHGLGVLALAWWLRAAGAAPVAIAAGLVLFAFSPATTSLALWQSNRNEALAVLAGLLALRAAWAHGGLRLPLVVAMLAISITSKETGVLFAVAVVAQALLRPHDPQRARIGEVAAAITTTLLVLGIRHTVVFPVDPSAEGGNDLLASMAIGFPAWWRHLPQALSGTAGVLATGLVAFGLLAALTAAAVRARSPVNRVLPAIGVLLLVAPAVLQSPITAVVLPTPGAIDLLVNLRFYAIAALGVAILVVAAWPARPSRAWLPAVVVLGCGIALASGSHRHAERWVTETRSMDVDAPRLAAAIAATLPPPPADVACVINVEGVPLAPGVRPYFDAMLRLQWPPGSAFERCLFAADGQLPWVAFMPAAVCNPGRWQPALLQVPVPRGVPFVAIAAGACQIALRPAGDRLQATHSLSWQALSQQPAATLPR